MNAFDSGIIQYLNQFAFRSPTFDRAVYTISTLYLTRGLMLIVGLWWIWFRDGATIKRDREIVITTVLASFITLVVGRSLAHWLPFRVRPFANPDLHVTFPSLDAMDGLRTWSAFPSDHAMMWCAIATGIYLADKRLGIVALLYSLIFIGLPRIYLGLHHPTDVLFGSLFGILICAFMNREPLRQRIAEPVLTWSTRHQGAFHVGIFLLSFELASQFDELRRLSGAVLRLL